MTVDLLYFAQIREAFGKNGETVDVEDGTTVEQLVATLRSREEWKSVASLPMSYAVNECVVDGGTRLRPGDRVAILTPISGG